MAVGSGSNLADFLVRLSYSVDQMAANATLQSLSSFSGQLAQLARSAMGVTSIITREMSRALTEISQIDRTSERLGITAGELDSITMATQMAGGSIQDVMGSLQSLSTKLGEGFLRIGGGAEVFRRLGVSVYNSKKEMKSIDELLVIISKRFNKMLGNQKFNPAARNALAKQLGITPEFARVLTSGFEEALAKYHDFSTAFNYNIEEMSKNTERFRRKWQETSSLFKILRRDMDYQIIMSLEGRINGLNSSLLNHAATIKVVEDGVASGISYFVKLLWAFAYTTGKALTFIADLFGPMGKFSVAITTFGVAIASVIGVVALFNPHLAAIIAAITGVILLLEDLFVYMEGGKSLPLLKPFWNFLAILLLLLEVLTNFFGALMDWSWALFHLFRGELPEAMESFTQGVDRLFGRKHYFDVIVRQNFSSNPEEREKEEFVEKRVSKRKDIYAPQQNTGELFNKSLVTDDKTDRPIKGGFAGDKFLKEFYNQIHLTERLSEIADVIRDILTKTYNWLTSPWRIAEYLVSIGTSIKEAVKSAIDQLIHALFGDDPGKPDMPVNDHKYPFNPKPRPGNPKPRPKKSLKEIFGENSPADPSGSQNIDGKLVKPVMRDFNGIQYHTPEGFLRVFGDKGLGAEGQKMDRDAYKRWTQYDAKSEDSWKKDTGLGIEKFPEPKLQSNKPGDNSALVASLGGFSKDISNLGSTLSLKNLSASAGNIFHVKQDINLSPHIEVHGITDPDSRNREIAAQLEIADTVTSRLKGYFNPEYYPAG